MWKVTVIAFGLETYLDKVKPCMHYNGILYRKIGDNSYEYARIKAVNL